jgi:FixJ family two-component response regulator
MSDEATIFVVDDDPFALRIVGQILRTAGYSVEVFDGPRAFLASEPFGRHGCVVLDMSMPDLTGLDLQEVIAERGGTLPVVFITGSSDVRSSVRAMKGGAVDFLLKPVDSDELLGAVGRAVSQSARARAAKAARSSAESRFSQLTPREREVCELVARGMLNKQVAAELGMSEATVKVHRARVMEKLELGSVAELSALMERLRG